MLEGAQHKSRAKVILLSTVTREGGNVPISAGMILQPCISKLHIIDIDIFGSGWVGIKLVQKTGSHNCTFSLQKLDTRKVKMNRTCVRYALSSYNIYSTLG